MILPFKAFLQEKFQRGLSTQHGYCEVYVSPTADEIATLTYDSPYTQLGGIIAGTKLYVWTRDYAMHGDVKWHLPTDPDYIPLYIKYDAKNRIVNVELSQYTMALERRKGWLVGDVADSYRDRILKNPDLKRLGTIKLKRWDV